MAKTPKKIKNTKIIRTIGDLNNNIHEKMDQFGLAESSVVLGNAVQNKEI